MKKITILSAFKDYYALFGIFLSGLSACNSLKSFFNFMEDGVFGGVLDVFDKVIVDPVSFIFKLASIEISKSTVVLLVLYIIFGSTTIRTIFNIYHPNSGMVVKGFWGRFSQFALANKNISQSKILKFLYVVLAVVIWPVIVIEYSIFWRYVWHRYLDTNGAPELDAKIGTFTSNAKSVKELIPNQNWSNYNPVFDYNVDSDSWYARRGNFINLFLVNFLAVCLVVLAVSIFSYMTV